MFNIYRLLTAALVLAPLTAQAQMFQFGSGNSWGFSTNSRTSPTTTSTNTNTNRTTTKTVTRSNNTTTWPATNATSCNSLGSFSWNFSSNCTTANQYTFSTPKPYVPIYTYTPPKPPKPLTLVEIGEKIYNDKSLSSPYGQSCASCHTESAGFADPRSNNPSSLGADNAHFGTRNSPTAAYAAFIPDRQTVIRPNPLTQQPMGVAFGGLFIDGRADTLEEQAKIPFFNPIEMGLSSPADLVNRLRWRSYAKDFKAMFGSDVFYNSQRTLNSAAIAIAAFERSEKFSPFTSKFDRVMEGTDTFSASEARGEALFNGKANCAFCHTSPTGPEVFSDFLYHNVGTPRNEQLLNNIGNPSFVDLGLGGVTNQPHELGQFRTPTLRNVAITAPYMHNGVFTTLREVVEFYNNRVTVPEVSQNMPPPFLAGQLGLSANEVDDIVSYLKTLTDK